MGGILIRPEDLARLARRLDAAADDAVLARRRLLRSTEEAALNRDDDEFAVGRFLDRAAQVQGRLGHLADGFKVDAALLSHTAAEGEFDDGGGWLTGLLVGWGSAAETTWSAVAAGLEQLRGRASGAAGAGSRSGDGSTVGRLAVPGGGVFAVVSRAVGEASAQVGAVLGGLAADVDDGRSLWSRIVDGLDEVPDERSGGDGDPGPSDRLDSGSSG